MSRMMFLKNDMRAFPSIIGETREQIQQLETKLCELKEEKHQLFLQLKKVLNEDDNRKRQFKDSKYTDSNFTHYSEMLQPQNSMMGQGVQGSTIVHSQPFLPPTAMGQSGPPPPPHNRPLSAHLSKPPMASQSNLKRGRSPSPTYASAVAPAPMPPHLTAPQQSPAPYTNLVHQQHQQIGKHSVYTNQSHKMEDGRIGREMARAVLWNKPSQYSGLGSSSSGVSAATYFAQLNQTQDRHPTGTMMYATPPTPPPAHLAYQTPQYHTQEAVKHEEPCQYGPMGGSSGGVNAAAYFAQLNQSQDRPPTGTMMYATPPPPPAHLAYQKPHYLIQDPGKHEDKQNTIMIGLSESGQSSSMPYVSVLPTQVPSGGPRHPSNQMVGHPSAHATLASHVSMGGPTMPIYTTVQQGSKPGGITSGYPVRPPPVSAQNQIIYSNRHRYQ